MEKMKRDESGDANGVGKRRVSEGGVAPPKSSAEFVCFDSFVV